MELKEALDYASHEIGVAIDITQKEEVREGDEKVVIITLNANGAAVTSSTFSLSIPQQREGKTEEEIAQIEQANLDVAYKGLFLRIAANGIAKMLVDFKE